MTPYNCRLVIEDSEVMLHDTQEKHIKINNSESYQSVKAIHVHSSVEYYIHLILIVIKSPIVDYRSKGMAVCFDWAWVKTF